jgi:hypothetical protein
MGVLEEIGGPVFIAEREKSPKAVEYLLRLIKKQVFEA